MLNASSVSQDAVSQPQNTFLLVQEIVDEDNYRRLSRNVQGLHTLCVGGTDKVRLIFSNETPATLSHKVFHGLDRKSKATLLLLSNMGLSPNSVLTPGTTK